MTIRQAFDAVASRCESELTAPALSSHPVDLSSQLGWLEGAGFVDVDCAYKNMSFAVYSGRRP